MSTHSKKNAQLQVENAELRTRLAQNSANSHKPPASDGYQKKPLFKLALPKMPGKKHGGQAGHSSKTLQVKTPDTVQRHQATHYQQCGLALKREGKVVAQRQVFDLPEPRLWVEEHQLIAHQVACGCIQTGRFPDAVAAPVQYGPASMPTVSCSSVAKVANLLDRLISRQAAVLVFAFEPGVPFTAQRPRNNQAERDLHPVKVKQKVSNCFRTLAGASYYARISGLVSTMRKNKMNVVEQLTNVLSGSFAWAT